MIGTRFEDCLSSFLDPESRPRPFCLKEHHESGLLLSPQSEKSLQKILFPFSGSPPFNLKQHSSIYLQIHIIASSTTSSTTTVASQPLPTQRNPLSPTHSLQPPRSHHRHTKSASLHLNPLCFLPTETMAGPTTQHNPLHRVQSPSRCKHQWRSQKTDGIT